MKILQLTRDYIALGRSLRMAPFTVRPWLALGAAAVFGSWPPFRGLTTREEV